MIPIVIIIKVLDNIFFFSGKNKYRIINDKIVPIKVPLEPHTKIIHIETIMLTIQRKINLRENSFHLNRHTQVSNMHVIAAQGAKVME